MLPAALVPLARELLAGAYENTSGTLLSLSAVAALWSAGRGTRGLLLGLNAVYGIRENRGYLHTRVVGAVYTFLFLLMVLLTLTGHVFSSTILDYLCMTTNPWIMALMETVDLRLVVLLLLTGFNALIRKNGNSGDDGIGQIGEIGEVVEVGEIAELE